MAVFGLKKWARTSMGSALIVFTVFVWLRAIFATLRIENHNPPTEFLRHRRPFIVAFWHSRMLFALAAWPFQRAPIYMFSSYHPDSRLISRVYQKFGARPVYGSSTRGGIAGFVRLAKLGREGNFIAMTPDGPLGPRQKLAPGVVKLAQLTGLPIIPLSANGTRQWVVKKSWDLFTIPQFFSKLHLNWGDPIYLKKTQESLDSHCAHIEAQLNQLLEASARHCKAKTGKQ